MTDRFIRPHIDTEYLISLVKQKPAVWDRTTELYKNRAATQMAWKKIVKTLNTDHEKMDETARQRFAKIVLQKWTHVRDSYCKYLKKAKKAGKRPLRRYIYSEQLSFLDKIFIYGSYDNSSVKNYNSGSEEDESDESDASSYTEKAIKPEPSDSAQNLSKSLENQEVPIETDMFNFDNDPITPYEPPRATNRHLSFFNAVLPTVETFNDNEVLEFQMGVLQLLKSIKSSRQANN